MTIPVINTNKMNSPLWLIMLVAVLILFISIYMFRLPLEFVNYMDEGDFGRDLYNFWLVSQGKLPYIDFNWIYGPLVPLLYGMVFKVFGVSAFNAIVLWYLNFVVSVFLLFYVVKSFANSFMAFIASLVFILYYEGFLIPVFNHVTGLIFILLSILFLFKYLTFKKTLYLYLIAISCFMLMMVKLNIGIAFSVPILSFIIFFNLKDKNHLKHILYSFSLISFLLFFLYLFILSNTPFDQIVKSFPYGANSHTSYEKAFIIHDSLFTSSFIPDINSYLNFVFYFSNLNLWYFVVIIICLAFSYVMYKRDGLDSPSYKFVLILSFAALITTHEFLLIGSSYSLTMWTLIIIVILIFYIINYILTEMTFNHISSKFFGSFVVLMFFFIIVKFYVFVLPLNTITYKCDQKRLQVSVLNFYWYHLMTNMTKYIIANTSQGERLFCYPYCALYNFTSSRFAPSRFTEFLYISNITEADQKQIIKDIEKNKVKLVLNVRIESPLNLGYGRFGETHCLLLYDYIQANYKLDKRFYDDYLDGMRVPVFFYKRKTPFKL